MRRLIFPALLGAVAACTSDGATPAATTSTSVQAAATSASAATTAFDGTYKGVKMALVAGGPNCGTMNAPRDLVIKDGQARMLWNSSLGSYFTGAVAADGKFNMVVRQQSASSYFGGAVTGNEITGRTSGSDCQYEMTWKKA
jgi:hypothetical protein